MISIYISLNPFPLITNSSSNLIIFFFIVCLHVCFCWQVCDAILVSGRRLAREEQAPCPLMFEWHDKKYLGAAHGLAGILHTLLLVPSHPTYCEKQTLHNILYCFTFCVLYALMH